MRPISRAVLGCLAALAPGACSEAPRRDGTGQVLVALTIDWEGAYFSPEGLDALDALRGALPRAPLTHFISAAYFTKAAPDPQARATLTAAIRPGDEAAVHLHAWRSLAQAAGVTPKLSPSFLSGTNRLFEFDDGDAGFDTDLDVYTEGELRSLVRTSRTLLETNGVTLTTAFRAGGFLGSPRLLQAIPHEGFTVDSSSIDARQVEAAAGEAFSDRVGELWPELDTASQPFSVALRGGSLLELPVAAFADYVAADELVRILREARAALAKDGTRDVIVVLGFHQETCDEFAPVLLRALETVRGDGDIAFVTVDEAVARVRAAGTVRTR